MPLRRWLAILLFSLFGFHSVRADDVSARVAELNSKLTELEWALADLPSYEEFMRPCSAKVDSSKILFFVDTNSAFREVNVAKQVACQRGLRFESLPSLEAIYKTGLPMELLTIARDRKNYLEEICKAKPSACDPIRLKTVTDDYNLKEQEAAKVGGQFAYTPRAALLTIAARFAQEKAKVQAMVVSGHHYEYAFFGDYLTPDRLRDDQNGPYGSDVEPTAKQYPEVFSDLTTLGMWGCSGITVKKIDEWKSYFPSVRLMAGYSGTAPNSMRPDNLNFLRSFLTQAPNLLRIREASIARNQIAALASIRQSFSGAYLKLADNGGEYIYQVTAPRSGYNAGKWRQLLAQDHCESFLKRLPKIIERVHSYESGTAPIPVDSDGSDLKADYFDLQINGDCMKGKPEAAQYNSPRVGLLRFFETGVKPNFAAKFYNELKLANAELYGTNKVEVRAQGTKKHPGKVSAQTINANTANVVALLGGKTLAEFISTEPRSQILILNDGLKGVARINPSRIATGTVKLNYISRAIQKILVELHPECTEMLQWHQPHFSNPPAVSCQI